MISINLKGEYRADPWDYIQPRMFPGWFLVKRGRGGMAENAEFNTREEAEKRRVELLEESPGADILVVEHAVVVTPCASRKADCIRFHYNVPKGIDMQRARGQFEQFWRQDTRCQADRIAWYIGEVQALMGTAGTALDAAEDRQMRDGKSFVVYSGGQPSMHATDWVGQIQQDCRLSVHAELFHRAAELGMKAVVVAECGGRVPTHELGHNLGTVWRAVSKDRQREINRIFDREYRQTHPASKASFGALAEAYGAEHVKGGKNGVYDLLRYRGDDPKPLSDPNIAHHLWKMASTLQLHYVSEVAGFTVMLHGVLTGYRNTIH